MAKDKTIPDAITHLQIIHTWAKFAIKHNEALCNELPKVSQWTMDALNVIDGLLSTVEEQRGTIDRLEHELAAARVVLSAKGDHDADQ